MLSIDKALRVYYLLEPHLPDNIGEDLLDFIGVLVNNIKESDTPEVYVDVLGVILDEPAERVVLTVKPEESFIILAKSLEDNRLLSLRDFVRTLENG